MVMVVYWSWNTANGLEAHLFGNGDGVCEADELRGATRNGDV